MKQDDKNTKIFINPSGFIEQHFYGNVSPETALDGLKQLRAYAKKQKAAGKKVLILEDAAKLSKIDYLNPKMVAVRKETDKAAREINFERAAVCGQLHLQVIISTLALIAGKRNHIKVFDSRSAAIKWLLSE
jgi:SpoU rRNA methylase family enzyme